MDIEELSQLSRPAFIRVVYFVLQIIKHRFQNLSIETKFAITNSLSGPLPESVEMANEVIRIIEGKVGVPVAEWTERQAATYAEILAEKVEKRISGDTRGTKTKGQKLLKELRESYSARGVIADIGDDELKAKLHEIAANEKRYNIIGITVSTREGHTTSTSECVDYVLGVLKRMREFRDGEQGLIRPGFQPPY